MFLQSLTHVGEAEIILDDAAAAAAIAPYFWPTPPRHKSSSTKLSFESKIKNIGQISGPKLRRVVVVTNGDEFLFDSSRTTRTTTVEDIPNPSK